MAAPESAGYPKKRAQTRRRLLEAGMVVLARRGPDGATVGEIAGEAGVAAGTFYNHFPSLMDLVEAVTAELQTTVEIASDTLTEIENDPAARVAIGTKQLLDLPHHDPVSAAAFVALLASTPAFRNQIRSVVGRAIEVGVEVGRFRALSVTAATDAVLGSVVQWIRSTLADESGDASPAAQIGLVLRLLGLADGEIQPVIEQATLTPATG